MQILVGYIEVNKMNFHLFPIVFLESDQSSLMSPLDHPYYCKSFDCHGNGTFSFQWVGLNFKHLTTRFPRDGRNHS